MTALAKVADGHYALSGPVTFFTVARLVPDGTGRRRRAGGDQPPPDLFDGEGPIKIDLAGVSAVDSAALALLIEWLREAQKRGRELVYANIPEKLQDIARLSGMGDWLA